MDSYELKAAKPVLGVEFVEMIDNFIKKQSKDFIEYYELEQTTSYIKKHRKEMTKPLYRNLIEYFKTKDVSLLSGMWLAVNKKGILLKQNTILKAGTNTKTLFLDANLDGATLNHIMSSEVEIKEMQVRVKAGVELFALKGRGISRTRMAKGNTATKVKAWLWDEIARERLTNPGLLVGIISYKNLNINGESVDFTSYLANCDESIIKMHYGDCRGYNTMQSVDLMFVVGDYNIPQNALVNHFVALYDEYPRLTKHKEVRKVHTKDRKIVDKVVTVYDDPRMEAVKQFLQVAESSQALGRARFLYGKAKKVYFLNSGDLPEYLEVDDWIDLESIVPLPIISDDEMEAVKLEGFVVMTRKNLMAKFNLTIDQYEQYKELIMEELKEAGGVFKEDKTQYGNRAKKVEIRCIF